MTKTESERLRREYDRLHTELGRFIVLVCILGIAVPLVGAVACDYWYDAAYSNGLVFVPLYLWFLATIIVALVCPIYILYQQLPRSLHSVAVEGDPAPTVRFQLPTVRRQLYGVGFLTAGLMGTIVAMTGGPLESPFVFYLLYLPAITAVSFTPSEEKIPKKKRRMRRLEGPGVLIVAIVCALLLIVGLWWHRVPPGFTAFHGSLMHKIWYLGMAAIQLGSIVVMEYKSRQRESPKGQ